jgi:hypothetical protein
MNSTSCILHSTPQHARCLFSAEHAIHQPACSLHALHLLNQQTDAKPQQPQQQQPGEELPIWVQREKMRELEAQAKPDLPWPLYLLLSSFVAIASVSSLDIVLHVVLGLDTVSFLQHATPVLAQSSPEGVKAVLCHASQERGNAMAVAVVS